MARALSPQEALLAQENGEGGQGDRETCDQSDLEYPAGASVSWRAWYPVQAAPATVTSPGTSQAACRHIGFPLSRPRYTPAC